MGPIGRATLIALGGVVALLIAMAALEPDVPRALVAVYNLWLLGTVVVLVVYVIASAFRFFAFISGKGRSDDDRG